MLNFSLKRATLHATLFLPPPERLHAAPHRSQEESDGDSHHAAGVRRLHQHGDAPGDHAAAPRGAGRERGRSDAAAGAGRSYQHGQQGTRGDRCLSLSSWQHLALIIDLHLPPFSQQFLCLRPQSGLTPLHLAAQEDKVNVAEVLVNHGATVDPETKVTLLLSLS